MQVLFEVSAESRPGKLNTTKKGGNPFRLSRDNRYVSRSRIKAITLSLYLSYEGSIPSTGTGHNGSFQHSDANRVSGERLLSPNSSAKNRTSD